MYYVKLNEKLDDFVSIQPFDEAMVKSLGRDKAMTFRQAKREVIKLHLRRVAYLKTITEKEYNANNSRTSKNIS